MSIAREEIYRKELQIEKQRKEMKKEEAQYVWFAVALFAAIGYELIITVLHLFFGF